MQYDFNTHFLYHATNNEATVILWLHRLSPDRSEDIRLRPVTDHQIQERRNQRHKDAQEVNEVVNLQEARLISAL